MTEVFDLQLQQTEAPNQDEPQVCPRRTKARMPEDMVTEGSQGAAAPASAMPGPAARLRGATRGCPKSPLVDWEKLLCALGRARHPH